MRCELGTVLRQHKMLSLGTKIIILYILEPWSWKSYDLVFFFNQSHSGRSSSSSIIIGFKQILIFVSGNKFHYSRYYSEPWVPSHLPVSSLLCLHPQNPTTPSSVALKTFGPRPVPAWAPSHSGWFWDFPHIQIWYSFPASTCIGYGLFCGTSGSVIFFFYSSYL